MRRDPRAPQPHTLHPHARPADAVRRRGRRRARRRASDVLAPPGGARQARRGCRRRRRRSTSCPATRTCAWSSAATARSCKALRACARHRRAGVRGQLRHGRASSRRSSATSWRTDSSGRSPASSRCSRCRAWRPRWTPRHRSALNDVSLIRRPHGRVAELSYRLGGREVGHVRCDGLVAATPAGSTGYNLANQGPILAWGVEGYVVSFIAPHTLTARPLVVAPQDVLSISNAPDRDPVDIVLDGQYVGELASGGEMRRPLPRRRRPPGPASGAQLLPPGAREVRAPRALTDAESRAHRIGILVVMERKWWTLLAGLRGDVHVAARHHDRQRRPARHPARPRGVALEPAMGGRRLRAHPRHLPDGRRLARRPAGPAAGVLGRLRALHLRLVPLRDRPRPDAAQPRPRPAGDRRRRDVRDRAGADRPGVRGPRARHRDRRLGRDRRRRGRDRPAGRRRCSPRASAGSGSSSSTSRSGSPR